MVTLGETLVLMKKPESNDRPENIKIFERVFIHNNFTLESLLKDYLQYIYDDTEKWLKDTLPDFKTEKAIRNQKTPINNIIKGTKYPALANCIDDNIRKELPKRFTDIVNSLVEEGRFTQKRNKTTAVETESEISEESYPDDPLDPQNDEIIATLTKEMNELKLKNNELKLKNNKLQEEKREIKNLMLSLLNAYKKDVNSSLSEFAEEIIQKFIG